MLNVSNRIFDNGDILNETRVLHVLTITELPLLTKKTTLYFKQNTMKVNIFIKSKLIV